MLQNLRHPLLLMFLAASIAPGSRPACAQDAARKANELKLSVAVGPAYALGKAAEQWAKLVAERSGGEIAVKLHPGATLAQRDPGREFLALREGAADLAVGSTLPWSAQVNELALVGLPWLAPDSRGLVALSTGAMRERLFAAIERAGAVPLALAPLGHRAIATIGRPVRTPEDVAGLRVRVTSMPFLVDFYAGIKAQPQAMPFAAAADAFRSDGLDAQEGPVAAFAAMRLDGLGFRHLTLWGAVGEIAVFAVNRAVWDAWTVEQRGLVGDAAREIARGLPALAAAEEDTALALLAGRGMSVLRLTGSGRAAFAAASRRTYDQWAAVAGEELVRAAESAVKLAPAAP